MLRTGLVLFAIAVAGCGESPPPRLLLLITVDTLRADHLGAYGDDRGMTPELDAWAARSVVFRSAYAASSFTLPSVAALMTGRHPEALGLWNNESRIPESVPTLAAVLRAKGWRTAAVVSNWVLRESTGIGRGFDVFDDEFPDQEATRGWPERLAPDTTDAALATLDACTGVDARCFLWVHYQDPHGPYTPSDARRERWLASERLRDGGAQILEWSRNDAGTGGIPRYQVLYARRDVAFYRAGYAGEVNSMDAEVGRLLAGVEARGLTDRAVLAFTADHGESLGEDDLWFAHGELLSEPIIRVPLFVSAGSLTPDVRDDIVSGVDLFPTLARLATGQAAAPAGEAPPGRDVFGPDAARQSSVPFLSSLGGSSVPRYAIVDGDYKLVVSDPAGSGDAALSHRGSDAPVSTLDAREIAASLRERLDAQRASLRRLAPERQELTDQDLEHLRSLGYATE
ncbi:MAG: sulfatase [Myxococcales bacterium]|nr:sulfatase [Myxococcales bacterium]